MAPIPDQGPDQRFPRSARLLSADGFKRVFSRPVRSADALFTVLARRRPAEAARLGLAISKKQARHAVQRNRIKRLAREQFRHHRTMLAGLDIVVMARSAAAQAPKQQLAHSLRSHFERLADSVQK